MARRKKPENETEEQQTIRQKLELVCNGSSRSEKTSWNRKLDKMVKLMAQLRPVEEQILELIGQKTPIFDEIQDLRKTMVNECIHPFDYLTLTTDNILLCKFCERKLKIHDLKKT